MKRRFLFNLIGWFYLPVAIMCMHTLHSQQPYQFTTYTTEEGLSDNRVTCVFKDNTGYIWVGTENGLNRFDGHSFLIYQPGRQKNALSNSIINDIKQDRYGHLWVATQNGLNRIDMASDTTIVFQPADTHGYPERTIPSNLVWSLYIDNNDRVWMAPDLRDLCYYDIGKKKFIRYRWFDYLEKNFPYRHNKYNSIRKIYRKSENELWLGTSAGLFSVNIHTGVFTHYQSWEADHFIQLVSDSATNTAYFIQQPGNAVQALHINSGKTQTIPFKSIAAPGYNDFGNNHWLPAHNQLLRINPVTQTLSKIRHETDNFYSLPKGNLSTVYQDDSGLLWIGSDAGLSKVNPSPGVFQFFPVFDDIVTPLKMEKDLFRQDHLLHSVLYDSTRARFYLSSSTKNCFLIINSRTGNKKTFTEINGIPLKNCSYLYKDKNGMIWILANGHAFIYDPEKNEFISTAFKCAASFFTGVTEDADGNMWIAGYNDGVYKYDSRSKVTTKLIDKNECHSDFPTSLYLDEGTKTLWIGTFSIGVYNYNISTGQFQYFLQSTQPGKINTSLITGITKSKDGKLWISSYAGGVSVYDPLAVSGKFTSVNTANGLPDDNVYSIIADGKGKIWGTTYYGLFSIDEDSRRITVYNRNHGLHYTDFHSRFTLSEDGTIITAVDKGFIRFGNNQVRLRSRNFPVVIQGVRTQLVNNIINPYSTVKEVRLNFDNNEVTFDFAALSFYAPGLTLYEYMLSGLDKQWQQNGNNPSVRYTHLLPGSYIFKVRAIDYTGRRSYNEASISVTIVPPWWQTWWFRLTALIVVVSGIIYIIKRNIKRIKSKAATRLQIQGLKEKALRAQMNPHFIFNSLNAIQELVITENYTASYEYLSKFSKLVRMVLQASEKNFHPLHTEIEIIRLYIELESLRFRHLFRYNIHLPEYIDAENTSFPSLLLQPFVENAIWHGLLQKDGLKELEITFSEKENRLICVISDNGIGRKKAQLIKQKKLGAHRSESKGIQMTRERLKILQLTGDCSGDIHISDRQTADGEVTGTLVEITIVFNENQRYDENTYH